MTREEARKTIDDILACFGNKPGDGTYELTQLDAKDMREAIERLSVVECEDTISRADAISLFKDDVAAVNELMQLESVHPKVCECEDAISRQAVLDGIDELKKSPWATDKRGNGFEYLIKEALEVVADLCVKQLPSVTQKQKMGHCKECKYFEYDSWAMVDGIPLIVAHEICSKWGGGCKTNEDGYCFLYEPQESED